MGKLKTRDRLWFIPTDPSCAFCRCEAESHAHLFFACNWTGRLWDRIKDWLHIGRRMSSISSALRGLYPKRSNLVSRMRRVSLGITVYLIWEERNKRIFDAKSREVEAMFRRVPARISRLLGRNSFQGWLRYLAASRDWFGLCGWVLHFDRLVPSSPACYWLGMSAYLVSCPAHENPIEDSLFMGLFLRWSLRDHRVSKLLYLFSWHNLQGSFGSILLLTGLLSLCHPMMTLLFLFRHRGSLDGAHDFDFFMLAPNWAIWMGVFCKYSSHVASSQILFGGLAVILPLLWASTLIMGKVSLCSDFIARVSSSMMCSPWVINDMLALHSVGLSTSLELSACYSYKPVVDNMNSISLVREGGDPFFNALLSGEYWMEHISINNRMYFGCCNFGFTGRPLEIVVKDLFLARALSLLLTHEAHPHDVPFAPFVDLVCLNALIVSGWPIWLVLCNMMLRSCTTVDVALDMSGVLLAEDVFPEVTFVHMGSRGFLSSFLLLLYVAGIAALLDVSCCLLLEVQPASWCHIPALLAGTFGLGKGAVLSPKIWSYYSAEQRLAWSDRVRILHGSGGLSSLWMEALLLLLHAVGYSVLPECSWESRSLALLAYLADVRLVAFVLVFGCQFGTYGSSFALYLLAFGLFLTMANKKKKSGSHRSQLKQQASQLINDRSVLALEAPPLPNTVHVTVPPNSNSPHQAPAVVPTTVLVHDSPNHGEHSPSINHIFVDDYSDDEEIEEEADLDYYGEDYVNGSKFFTSSPLAASTSTPPVGSQFTPIVCPTSVIPPPAASLVGDTSLTAALPPCATSLPAASPLCTVSTPATSPVYAMPAHVAAPGCAMFVPIAPMRGTAPSANPVREIPNSSKPPFNPWRNLFVNNRNTVSCPRLIHYSTFTDTKGCNLVDDDLDTKCELWKLCLVGYIAGRYTGFKALQNLIDNTWKCEASLTIHESRWLIFKFAKEDDKLNVLSGGPYLVFGRPLILRAMPEYFDFSSSDMYTIPVWVKFPNLPLKCWYIKCLSKIASVLGKPVQSDMLTSSMARLSYARVLVEVNLLSDLPYSIEPSNVPSKPRANDSVAPVPNITKGRDSVLNRLGPQGGTSVAGCSEANQPANCGPNPVPVVDETVSENETVMPNSGGLGACPEEKSKAARLPSLPPSVACNISSLVPADVAGHRADKGKSVGRGVACPLPSFMLIRSWNVRGLNNPLKQHEVVSLMRKNKLDVCGLLETKLVPSKVSSMQQFRLKKWKVFSNAAAASTARIVVFWNPATVNVELLDFSAQGLHVLIYSLVHQFKFYASFVYGFNTVIVRRTLWDDLRSWSPTSPWLILGDFNSLLSQADKHDGEPVSNYETTDFRQCCSDLGLTDLNYSGCHYTWSNGRVWSKLDRVLVNPLWSLANVSVHVQFDNPGAFSDHSPATVAFFTRQLMAHWTYSVYGPPMFILCKRLKNLKRPLRDLNKLHYSHISERVARAEAAVDTHQTLHDRDNIHLQAVDKQLRQGLLRLKEAERLFFSQKLKCNFLKECDKGSSFFHSLMNRKHRQSCIPAIQRNDGTVTTSIDEVGAAFVDFYMQLLGSSKETLPLDSNVVQHGPILDDASHASLLAPVTDLEIKNALFAIDDDKAPGPDGFSSCFFKKAWNVIGGDFCAAVRDFFVSGALLKQINHSIITLIPKSANTTLASDFRSISCCNVIYKVIAKILAMRLSHALVPIISPLQNAFLGGRLMADNIHLVQELLRNYERKRASPRCLMKIDFRKAFDSVQWPFLRQLLLLLGFPNRFVHLVMQCVETVSYSVSVNGNIYGFFPGMNGIRQGDPLSPYLFIVCMEYLSRMLQIATLSPSFRFHPKCDTLGIYHLAFADDVILLSRGDRHSVSTLFQQLHTFGRTSGLEINASKSSIFFGGVSDSIRQLILSDTGFAEGSFPFRYLGVPLSPHRLLASQYSPLIHTLDFAIQSWMGKHLSYAGRLELLKSILYGIIQFWLNIFLVPDTDEGGLGFFDLRARNNSCQAKHIWNIHLKADSIWIQWVHHYYICSQSFWDTAAHPNSSPLWKSIINFRDKLVEMGCGQSQVLSLMENWCNSTGSFTANAYEYLWLRSNPVYWRKIVWEPWSMPRYSFILWLAVLGRLQTKDRLHFLQTDLTCVFCQDEEESHNHLFFSFHWISPLWQMIRNWLHITRRMSSLSSAIRGLSRVGNNAHGRMRRVSLGILVYIIWEERNKRLFDCKSTSLPSLFRKFQTLGLPCCAAGGGGGFGRSSLVLFARCALCRGLLESPHGLPCLAWFCMSSIWWHVFPIVLHLSGISAWLVWLLLVHIGLAVLGHSLFVLGSGCPIAAGDSSLSRLAA
ncbi:hypothetical protein NC651_038440 [Populus alba x Populus x berolinensis]|nr:hypothetical protein NC651_038440 [Populus alba x Populus x berolinensis]